MLAWLLIGLGTGLVVIILFLILVGLWADWVNDSPPPF